MTITTDVVTRLGAFVLALAVGVPRTAAAADIVGRVAVGAAGLGDAVVSIEGPVAAAPAVASEVAIDHRDLRFVPHVVVVPVGSRVRFDNSDGMPCRIYCVWRTGSFVRRDRAAMPLNVEHPGIIEVRCADHPKLSAFVVVRANPYAAITNDAGQYAIHDVPPGKYRLQIWRDGVVLTARTIVVGAATMTMNIDR